MFPRKSNPNQPPAKYNGQTSGSCVMQAKDRAMAATATILTLALKRALTIVCANGSFYV